MLNAKHNALKLMGVPCMIIAVIIVLSFSLLMLEQTRVQNKLEKQNLLC